MHAIKVVISHLSQLVDLVLLRNRNSLDSDFINLYVLTVVCQFLKLICQPG